MSYQEFEDIKKQFPLLSWVQIQRVMQHRPQQLWIEDCQALIEGTPWEYICEEACFGPISFQIAPPLLIPREDTWDWLEQTAKRLSPRTVLDLGTGPGTLGLGLNYLYCGKIELTATDINPVAIRIASLNFQKAGLKKWDCYLSDWLDSIPHSTFDLIISNPPYCDKDALFWFEDSPEDPNARFAPHGGLQPYYKIFSQAHNYMSTSSTLIVEHGADQGYAIATLAKYFGFVHNYCYKDLNGAWRATELKIA